MKDMPLTTAVLDRARAAWAQLTGYMKPWRLGLALLAAAAFIGTWVAAPYAVGLQRHWGSSVLMIVAVLSWLLYGKALARLFRDERMEQQFEQVKAHIETAFAEHADKLLPGAGNANVHQCWKKRGRSWGFMPETGWVEGQRGTCAEVHGDDGFVARVEARLTDDGED